MGSAMKKSVEPKPLTPEQIKVVLELLELRALAPQETAARFNRLVAQRMFSVSQQDAIEVLFALDDSEIPDALFDFVADEEARDIVRDQLVHEARMSYEPA